MLEEIATRLRKTVPQHVSVMVDEKVWCHSHLENSETTYTVSFVPSRSSGPIPGRNGITCENREFTSLTELVAWVNQQTKEAANAEAS